MRSSCSFNSFFPGMNACAIRISFRRRWLMKTSRETIGRSSRPISRRRERIIERLQELPDKVKQALQTNDNTFGALEEARKYLQKAFERPKEKQQ